MFRSSSIKHAAVGAALVAAFALNGAGAAGASSATARPSGQVATSMSLRGALAHAARQTHRFRGTVTSTNRSRRWFGMRTTSHRRLRIHTNSGTWWDDCDWGDMGDGHHVDVRAYRSHGMWFASSMHNWDDSGDWGDMWMD